MPDCLNDAPPATDLTVPVIPRRGDRRTQGPRRVEEVALHYARENLLAAAVAFDDARREGLRTVNARAGAVLGTAREVYDRAVAALAAADETRQGG